VHDGSDVSWIVVVAAPGGPAGGPADLRGEPLREWVRRQVAVWPAPIPIGEELPRPGAGTATFAGERYRGTFGADGSCALALPVGAPRDSPADGVRVVSIGEGAVAWIVVAALRLAAAFAERAGVRRDLLVEVTVTGGAAPYEVWNRDARGFGPVGDRLATVRPVRGPAELAACLSAGVAGVARPLVLDLLRQFGLAESRHIDAGGVLQRRHFTGYDERIRAWSEAIGAPSR
jgi:hypothetical protein